MPIGAPEVIANAPRERFAAFYNAYYRPERATLIAVGDFDVDEMERRIRARFASWRGEGAAGRDPDLGAVARAADAGPAACRGRRPGADVLGLGAARPTSGPTIGRRARARLADSWRSRSSTAGWSGSPRPGRPPPFVAGLGRSQPARRERRHHPAGRGRPARRMAPGARRDRSRAAPAGRAWRHRGRARRARSASSAPRLPPPPPAPRPARRRRWPKGWSAAVDQDDVFTAPAENLRLFDAGGGRADARAHRRGRAGDVRRRADRLHDLADCGRRRRRRLARRLSRIARDAGRRGRRRSRPRPGPIRGSARPATVAERRELPAEIGATAIRFANGVRLTVKQTDFADDQILVAVRFGNGRLGIARRPAQPGLGARRSASPPAASAGSATRTCRRRSTARVYGVGLGVDDDAFQLAGATRPAGFRAADAGARRLCRPIRAGGRPAGTGCARYSGTIHDQLASTPGGVFGRDAGALLHSGDRRWATPSARGDGGEQHRRRARRARPAARPGPDRGDHRRRRRRRGGDPADRGDLRRAAAARRDAARPPTAIRFPAGTAEPVRLTHRGRADQGLAYIAWPTAGLLRRYPPGAGAEPARRRCSSCA